MGEIDRVQQLAQAARMVNAYQRVNPTDPRNPPKKDSAKREDQADKLDLTQEDAEPAETGQTVLLAVEEGGDEDHLDIAV
jgi:hypothetical protein